MTSDYELIETIKHGPIRKGEALLIINGKTCRISITSLSMNYNVDEVPRMDLSCIIFPENGQRAIDTISELQEDR